MDIICYIFVHCAHGSERRGLLWTTLFGTCTVYKKPRFDIPCFFDTDVGNRPPLCVQDRWKRTDG